MVVVGAAVDVVDSGAASVVVDSLGTAVVIVVDVADVVITVAGTVVSEVSSDDPHAVAKSATVAKTSRYLFMVTPYVGIGRDVSEPQRSPYG